MSFNASAYIFYSLLDFSSLYSNFVIPLYLDLLNAIFPPFCF